MAQECDHGVRDPYCGQRNCPGFGRALYQKGYRFRDGAFHAEQLPALAYGDMVSQGVSPLPAHEMASPPDPAAIDLDAVLRTEREGGRVFMLFRPTEEISDEEVAREIWEGSSDIAQMPWAEVHPSVQRQYRTFVQLVRDAIYRLSQRNR